MLQTKNTDQTNDASKIISEADQLIKDIEKQLFDSNRLLSESGIDQKSLVEKASPKQLKEAKELFEKDMAEIEEEIAQAQARSSFSQVESRSKSFSRSMI